MSPSGIDALVLAERNHIAGMIERDLVPLLVRQTLLRALGQGLAAPVAYAPKHKRKGLSAKQAILGALANAPDGLTGLEIDDAVVANGLTMYAAHQAKYALRREGGIAKAGGVWRIVAKAPDPEPEAPPEGDVVEVLRQAGPDGLSGHDIAVALGSRGLGNAATVRALSAAKAEGVAIRDPGTGRWRLAAA